MKRVLNVGGNSKSIPLPPQYDNFEKVLLDIDPRDSPDIGAVMRTTIEQGLDIDDVLYQSSAGPIMVVDVLYGHGVEIEQSGQDFFAHKTGFTQKSLLKALNTAGFSKVYAPWQTWKLTSLHSQIHRTRPHVHFLNFPMTSVPSNLT